MGQNNESRQKGPVTSLFHHGQTSLEEWRNKAVKAATQMVLDRPVRFSSNFVLVGGIPTPLKNMKVNWDDDIPNISGTVKGM